MYWYEDFAAAGDEELVSNRRTITETDAVMFTRMTGIIDPVFTDELFAKQNLFGGRVVPGPMILAYAMGLTDDLIHGSVVAALGVDKARFGSPVRPLDTIWVLTTVVSARESQSRPDYGVVTLKHRVVSDAADQVQEFERTLLVLKDPEKVKKVGASA